ncbi:hypothetical protein ACIQGO_34945 [Streptomyces shenzhenensis]|uniref:hypothetical protein n=1 Tax=Streptomyces shenzhenensis TaxID=943815 RepID=UPI0038012A3F
MIAVDASVVEQVLTAWGRGYLAEVPAGIGFDVLLTPGPLAGDTVRRMCEAGRRTGPVVLGPRGAEFILERGSAHDWRAPHSSLLPPPGVHVPELVADRGWLVPPCHPETGAPLCAEVTPAGVLLEPYLASVETAREERRRCA